MQIRRFKRRFIQLCLCILVLAVTTTASAQTDPVPWAQWADRDLDLIGDDNTGSSVALSEADGVPALMVTPGGTADETKIVVPLLGADLAEWANYTTLDLQVYLPAANVDNPDNFFLGMADVTNGGFVWIAGVFSSSDAQPGWNTISYALHEAMRSLNPEHQYNLYFSFFKDEGSKIPLTEPFYLGTAALSGLIETTSGNNYDQEVADLLSLDDEAFIDAVARATFDYFWLEANPDNGLIKDRSTPDSVASIAAVGFGLAALPIGVDRGWITYDEGYQRALTTLQTFTSGGVEGLHGFFYHFVNMRTGQREWSSELSSIDTALLVAGALVSGQYFADTEVAALADQVYANVEWDWMAPGGALVKMGWTPDGGYFGAAWDHFDESMILYALAIGSPTHPVPARAWDFWDRPVNPRWRLYLSGGRTAVRLPVSAGLPRPTGQSGSIRQLRQQHGAGLRAQPPVRRRSQRSVRDLSERRVGSQRVGWAGRLPGLRCVEQQPRRDDCALCGGCLPAVHAGDRARRYARCPDGIRRAGMA